MSENIVTTNNNIKTNTDKFNQGSFPQDWTAYNTAQTKEIEFFMKLLADMCFLIPNSEYHKGRPTLPLPDMIFCSALKVYFGFSLRRFVGFMDIAKEKGYIDCVCSYSTISNYMRKPELTQLLHKLIRMSSLPLRSVEKDFAADSSGFSTSRFARYFSFKHGRDLKYRQWIKVHLMCGTKTNVVTDVQITEGNASDYPQLKLLVDNTAEVFQINEISCDKAYSGRSNLQLVADHGGTPYIPFKKNARAIKRGCRIWREMFHHFQYRRDEFMKHYHKRSNSETVFHMIKTKFRDNVKSKDRIAQINELLLKVLCHNICVVIQEMHELGIEPRFYDYEFNKTN